MREPVHNFRLPGVERVCERTGACSSMTNGFCFTARINWFSLSCTLAMGYTHYTNFG